MAGEEKEGSLQKQSWQQRAEAPAAAAAAAAAAGISPSL